MRHSANVRLRGEVVATCKGGSHSFRKAPCVFIKLVAGLGVEGDAHTGVTVQNRYLVGKIPRLQIAVRFICFPLNYSCS